MDKKKKLAFFSILSSGHLNVCAAIGSMMLNKFHDKIEIFFIVDREWANKLSKVDSRFQFGVFDYDNKNDQQRMDEIINKLEATLKMSLIEKQKFAWQTFTSDPTLIEVDTKSEEQIRLIQPDLIGCDQGWHPPAVYKSGIPYFFICSCNPLLYHLIPEYPELGCDAFLNEKDKIQFFNKIFGEFRKESRKTFQTIYEKRGAKYENDRPIDQAMTNLFNIYNYPQELDYYSEELKEKHKLWQIDSPLFKERIPEPFVLPQEFAELPGQIIYISLGSLFSAYTDILQKMCDILEKQPYKYIVSKGPFGDNLKFPSNKFIGENYVDQLAVLQVADMMITHAGNNSLTECFFFGKPCLAMPILFDQHNNASRLEELEYGYRLELMNYTEKQLADRISKILNDEKLKLKWKQASERIQRENRIGLVVDKLFEAVCKLG